MNEISEYALRILERAGAVIRNSHFVYQSGTHGSVYVDKWAVLPDPIEVSDLCRLLAQEYVGQKIDAVVGPAHGGIVLAFETARQLSRITGRRVLGFPAIRTIPGGPYHVKGSRADALKGVRVLVVEDILTTGATVRSALDAVHERGGAVVAIAVMVNRGGVEARDLGVPELRALVDLKLDAWAPEQCSLCKEGIPVRTDLGYGGRLRAHA